MSTISLACPNYESTARLDILRQTEYKYLDEQDHLYLDYTGAGLAALRQYECHKVRLENSTFGNPHSENPSSRETTDLIEATRRKILEYFNASCHEYQVIFTPNATGAAKLVGESYPFRKHSKLVLTYDNHNSLNGLREYARRARAETKYISMNKQDLRIDTSAVTKTLGNREHPLKKWPRCLSSRHKRGLFAYPAQSNFTGVRHPLSWVQIAQDYGYDVLLDAAAYLPTSKLDLSAVSPEFVMVSWYKVFGFPTGVGCLIARKDALSRLNRPYFAGGTVQAAAVGIPWHVMAEDEAAFEDGTVNYLSIPDVQVGIEWISSIGLEMIGERVRCLTGWFIDRLLDLRHHNGRPMAIIYGPRDTMSRGGTVAFNISDVNGNIVDERLVALESSAARISLRTGCFCNPGTGETAFGVSESALRSLSRIKHNDYEAYLRAINLPSGGAIRVSFGIASTAKDVDRFIAFATKTYQERSCFANGLPPRNGC